MSLHLIESRPPARVMVLRRPGANAVSVAMHAGLVTMAIIATATPPTFANRRPTSEERPVYVPTPTLPHSASPASRAPNSTTALPVPALAPLIAPVEIPTTIPEPPDVSTSPVPDVDFNAMLRKGVGAPNGVSTGTPSGSGSDNAVRDHLHVDRAVMLLPGAPLPRYPESLRQAGIQDTLMASFVVDTSGRMETGSLAFAGSPHVAFANAVRDALLHARFHPAEADGHKVRQLVQQPFVFTLSR